jgi:hypothetical protein
VKGLSDKYPILIDILVDPNVDFNEDEKRGVNFAEHQSISQISEGIKVCIKSLAEQGKKENEVGF